MTAVQYDNVGKVRMDGIYDQPDPRAYFATLSKLDYVIPQAGKPVFERLIARRREATGRDAVKLIDLGCSYGVNAVLLKHGLTMRDLYRHYSGQEHLDRASLVARDRRVFGRPADADLEIVGIDQAANAIAYGLDNGTLDAGIAADFEQRTPIAAEPATMEEADLIVSTGCFGYVTHVTLGRILDATRRSRPWMAHFVLRMFDFARARAMLAAHGYVTEKLDGLFAQRRFASPEERARVLANVRARGLDPEGAEATGWYFAEMFVARPRVEAEALPLERLMGEAG